MSQEPAAIRELIKKYGQWTERTRRIGITREAVRRQARIVSVIRKLGHAKASQIAKELYPMRKNPPITFYRDLKESSKTRIEKQWTREEGEFYVTTQELNQPDQTIWDLIDYLAVEADFFAEWCRCLQNAILEAVEHKKPPDYDKWLTFPIENVETLDNVEKIPRDMETLTKQIKAKLWESTVFRWKTRTTTRQQDLEKPPDLQKAPDMMKCSECGGAVFNTDPEDGREFCAKCGSERKT